MTERLADSLEAGEIHLDAWQEVWLSWLYQGDLAKHPRWLLPPDRRRRVAERPRARPSPSCTPDRCGGGAAAREAAAREFDRSTAAGREVLASAVSDLRGESVDRLPRTIAAEGALYRLLTPRKIVRRPALKRKK